MPKINHLLIEETFVSISPLNNLTRNEVNHIIGKFETLGIECELFDDATDSERSDISPYDLRILVNRDLKHRIILEIMADYRWITEELMNKYEPHIKRAEAAFEVLFNTRNEITPEQIAVLEQMIASDVDLIIDRCRNRKHAEFILKLCRYSPDANHVNQHLYQTCASPDDAAAIKASLQGLNKIYFLDITNSKVLLAKGGFVPDVKQVRNSYLEFIADKLDDEFEPSEPLTPDDQRRRSYINLQFIENVDLLDHVKQNDLIKQINDLYPDLTPMPLWPVDTVVVRGCHASFFAANKQQHDNVEERPEAKCLNK